MMPTGCSTIPNKQKLSWVHIHGSEGQGIAPGKMGTHERGAQVILFQGNRNDTCLMYREPPQKVYLWSAYIQQAASGNGFPPENLHFSAVGRACGGHRSSQNEESLSGHGSLSCADLKSQHLRRARRCRRGLRSFVERSHTGISCFPAKLTVNVSDRLRPKKRKACWTRCTKLCSEGECIAHHLRFSSRPPGIRRNLKEIPR